MTSLEPKGFLFFTFPVTSQVFYSTELSFAFVNIKPLLPGHVLVSPVRVVARLADLTDAEVADLFVTVKRVSRVVQRVYGATALTIPLQDGFDGGQTVPHVHVHIIPRHTADVAPAGDLFAIYALLESDEGDLGKFLALRRRTEPLRVDLESIPLRAPPEMAAEAHMLRIEMEKEEPE